MIGQEDRAGHELCFLDGSFIEYVGSNDHSSDCYILGTFNECSHDRVFNDLETIFRNKSRVAPPTRIYETVNDNNLCDSDHDTWDVTDNSEYNNIPICKKPTSFVVI